MTSMSHWSDEAVMSDKAFIKTNDSIDYMQLGQGRCSGTS